MARYNYPPPNFQCRYQDNCPHLQGLSTTWVWGEYELAGSRYQGHLRIIDSYDEELERSDKRIRSLEKENAELKAKFQALHQRQFKANRKKDTQKGEKPSGNINSSGKKKRGAPVGHPGWFRKKPEHVDQTVHVSAPEICPHCQSEKLTPIQELKEHFQEDIVLKPRTVVTRYLHKQAYCAHCSRPVIKAADNELLNAHIGPVAKSTAIYLRYRMALPYRKVQELFKDLFDLEFVPASALGFDKKAALKGEGIYEDLREKIKASPVVHADETSWRNDGMGHYAWYAGNADLAFFHIDRHRSSEVATSILGTDFGGVLVTDRYAAYNSTNPAERQTCLAHIIRRAKDIAQELSLLKKNCRDEQAESFCAGIARLFSRACKVGQKVSSGVIPFKHTPAIEKVFLKNLKSFCANELSFSSAETLRSKLIGKEINQLFTFLRHPGVPPTNNQAEQSIRSIVIFRKIVFGTRSEMGLRTHSILPSLILTARRQGKLPREFLQTLLTSDTPAAQAALFNNSS